MKYVDLSPISGNPCAAPCWHNLTIDKSTKEETLAALRSLEFIDQHSIKETSSAYWDPSYESHDSLPAQTIRASCREPAGLNCFLFDFVNGILKRIFIFPNYTITLQDAVNYFGEPSCLSLGGWGAECHGCDIQLSWDARQLLVSVLDKRCGEGTELCGAIRQGGKIPPDYVVQTIVYYSEAWKDNESQECFQWTGFEGAVP